MNPSVSKASRDRSRLKWYHLYYFLAAFNILTISGSLYLNHTILRIYSNSVEEDSVWSNRVGEYSKLNELAVAISAPGDDVFESHNIAGEKRRLAEAYQTFQEAVRSVRDDLQRNIVRGETAQLLSALKSIDDQAALIHKEGTAVLAELESNNRKAAGSRMAKMDQHLSKSLSVIGILCGKVREIQATRFDAETARATQLGYYEFAIVGAVCFMLCVVAWFGRMIAVRMRLSEGQLRESEEKFRGICSTAQNAIIMMDGDGNVTYWNDAAVSMFGYTAEEVIGKFLHSEEFIVPDRYRDTFFRAWPTFQESGQGDLIGQTFEVMATRKNRDEFPVEFSLSAVKINSRWHSIGILRDVTERKKNEESLRLQGAALESSANAIAITDLDGRFIWVNKAFSQMTGYSREKAVGNNPRILKSGHHEAAFYEDLWQTVLAGKVWQGEMVNRRKDGSLYTEEQTITPVADERGEITHFIAVKQDITDRKRAEQQLQEAIDRAEEAHAETRQLLGAMSSVLIGVDTDYRVTAWNRAAERTFGIDSENAMGHLLNELRMGWDYATIARNIAACHAEKRPVRIDETRFKRPDGTEGFLGITMNPVSDDTGRDLGFLLVVADITEHKILQGQLSQAQKLESVGQLAAGIAHEINTPTQYVGDNTRFLKEGFDDLSLALDSFEKLLQAEKDGTVNEQLVEEVEAVIKQADIEYLREEIPQAIDQSLNGVERVAKIVRAMKEFSHPGGEEKTLVNLTESIETTITVAHNEWKYVAEMVTEFDPDFPPVACLPDELNQVFLNLIVNAAHAIGDTLGDDNTKKGTITLGTRRDGEWVEIFVRDTGTGIPEDIRARIFDPFFTTKGVGKGTGQGLTIARSVVVDKHGGTLDCESELGKGTTFRVRLPIEGQPKTQGASNEVKDACSIR